MSKDDFREMSIGKVASLIEVGMIERAYVSNGLNPTVARLEVNYQVAIHELYSENEK